MELLEIHLPRKSQVVIIRHRTTKLEKRSIAVKVRRLSNHRHPIEHNSNYKMIQKLQNFSLKDRPLRYLPRRWQQRDDEIRTLQQKNDEMTVATMMTMNDTIVVRIVAIDVPQKSAAVAVIVAVPVEVAMVIERTKVIATVQNLFPGPLHVKEEDSRSNSIDQVPILVPKWNLQGGLQENLAHQPL